MKKNKFLEMVIARCANNYKRYNVKKVATSVVNMLPVETKKNLIKDFGKPSFSDDKLNDSYLVLITVNSIKQGAKEAIV